MSKEAKIGETKMAEEINFAKAAKERNDKIEEMRNLCEQMREIEENDPDYDPFESMQSLIDEVDPELALLIDEEATIAPQVVNGMLRAKGYDVPGSEFEKRRDEKAIEKETEIQKKIDKKYVAHTS